MPVSDWSKLASFDAATFQIFVVADSAVATVNAFVAEAISLCICNTDCSFSDLWASLSSLVS